MDRISEINQALAEIGRGEREARELSDLLHEKTELLRIELSKPDVGFEAVCRDRDKRLIDLRVMGEQLAALQKDYQHAKALLHACSRENEHMKPENKKLLLENKQLKGEVERLQEVIEQSKDKKWNGVEWIK